MSDDAITDTPEPDLVDDDDQLAGGEVEGDLDEVTEPDGSEADRLEQLTDAPLDTAEDEYRR
jgi:hypothetical protein